MNAIRNRLLADLAEHIAHLRPDLDTPDFEVVPETHKDQSTKLTVKYIAEAKFFFRALLPHYRKLLKSEYGPEAIFVIEIPDLLT